MSLDESNARGGLVGVAVLAAVVVMAAAWFLASAGIERSRERELAVARADEQAREAAALAADAPPTNAPVAPAKAPKAEDAPQAEEPLPAKGSQRAFVLKQGWHDNLENLNELLKKGWRVKQTCCMSAATDDKDAYCLVVLEME